jgi:hypothetical protein
MSEEKEPTHAETFKMLIELSGTVDEFVIGGALVLFENQIIEKTTRVAEFMKLKFSDSSKLLVELPPNEDETFGATIRPGSKAEAEFERLIANKEGCVADITLNSDTCSKIPPGCWTRLIIFDDGTFVSAASDPVNPGDQYVLVATTNTSSLFQEVAGTALTLLMLAYMERKK